MVTPAAGFDCEAYGPEGTAVGALCFFAEDLGVRVCGSAAECAARMAGERRRVHDRIQQQAAAGDEVMAALLREFPDARDLLGGRPGDDE